MRLRLLVALALALVACKSSPAARPTPAPAPAITLDIAEFQPPFDHLPIARAFIARHRIAKLTFHELEPGTTTAQSSEITEYDATGAPVRRYKRSGSEAPALVESVAYTRDDATPVAPKTVEMPGMPGMPGAQGVPGMMVLLDKVVILDRAGRIAKVRTQLGPTLVTETYTYDAAGNVTRIERRTEMSGTPMPPELYEELRTYTAGRWSKRTRGKIGAAPSETIEMTYDARGRFSEWRGSKRGFNDDRYYFTYDPTGQLASLRFQEGEKPIYRRDYTYDAEGFLTRIEQKSSVPAMNDATLVLEYELAGGQRRRAIEVAVPAPPKQQTDADVLAAVKRVFPTAADGTVRWGDAGGRRFVETVTFQVPATELGSATGAQLEAKACALRQALGYADCGCERLEPGSTRAGVTIVTFHLMLGC